MRQFDVCENPSPRTRSIFPYVVVLQSHLLGRLATTMVAPLMLDDGRSAFTESSVIIDLHDQRYILSIVEMASIPTDSLKRSVANLLEFEDAIRRALERIFTGF